MDHTDHYSALEKAPARVSLDCALHVVMQQVFIAMAAADSMPAAVIIWDYLGVRVRDVACDPHARHAGPAGAVGAHPAVAVDIAIPS